MGKKTKILAAGDLHGDTGLAKKLAEKARREEVDLVIIAGDITHFEQSIKNLVGPFAKEKKPVLLIHGNHETITTVDFLSQIYPLTKNLHGYSFSKEDLGIFGCGGADFGLSPMSEANFFRTLKRAHEGIKDKKTKIMVTHMHPYKSKAEFSGFRGSKGIRKALKEFKPDLLISGHIHEAEGMEEKIGKTKVINIGRRGRIIRI